MLPCAWYPVKGLWYGRGMEDGPLCAAPFAALTIDTNKGVRPCCAFFGQPGNLTLQGINQIREDASWRHIRGESGAQRWPAGCVGCRDREAETGWSTRQRFRPGNSKFPMGPWREGKLAYLELAGSSICNLACLHCSAVYSSKWNADAARLTEIEPRFKGLGQQHDPNYGAFPTAAPDPELVLRNLLSLDLSELRTLELKGGEPFLNPEIVAVLEYLESEGILESLRIEVTTNGTIHNPRLLRALGQARHVDISVSVDGVGDLNTYIRHGNSHTDRIAENIARFGELSNAVILRSTSIMAYNVA